MNLYKRGKKNIGLIITSIGVGVVLTVVIPFWGWIAAAGVGLICFGWKIMSNHHH